MSRCATSLFYTTMLGRQRLTYIYICSPCSSRLILYTTLIMVNVASIRKYIALRLTPCVRYLMQPLQTCSMYKKSSEHTLIPYFVLIGLVTSLSVNIKVKDPKGHLACKGYQTFTNLDTYCSPCVYGVHDLVYATVVCNGTSEAHTCCTDISSKPY
jgi:hypothetical protein